jgi:hypothetical protein
MFSSFHTIISKLFPNTNVERISLILMICRAMTFFIYESRSIWIAIWSINLTKEQIFYNFLFHLFKISYFYKNTKPQTFNPFLECSNIVLLRNLSITDKWSTRVHFYSWSDDLEVDFFSLWQRKSHSVTNLKNTVGV